MKSIIKISLAFVIIGVILLILLGLRSIDRGGTATSYCLLGGRKPISCKDLRTKDVDKIYAYSFEADFNDLCTKADAELIPAGFWGRTIVVKNLSDNDSNERYYWLKQKFPRGGIYIRIVNNQQYVELPNSNDYAICEKEGWAGIQIVYYRGWRWPF